MSQHEQVRKVLSWASIERIQRCREIAMPPWSSQCLPTYWKISEDILLTNTFWTELQHLEKLSENSSLLTRSYCDHCHSVGNETRMIWLRMIGTKRWHSRIKGTEDMITERDIKDKATIRACSIVETSGTELNVLFLEEKQIRCPLGSCSIWTSKKFSRQLDNAISLVEETEDQWYSISYQNLENDGPTH